ncbi:MAG TPA: hypothetical protein VM434_06385 [Beijerinckiaceae bacterium]|nr:hypothetical protein [Beijerinckiaceae bacterium]
MARDYTRGLIEAYAGGCRVALVGSRRLAGFAEAELEGVPAADADIRDEIAPCFVEEGGARTDAVVLACTHYPLLLARLRDLAPWPVAWIDPAPAIARRVVELLGPAATAEPEEALAIFTGGAGLRAPLRRALAARGLAAVEVDSIPLG